MSKKSYFYLGIILLFFNSIHIHAQETNTALPLDSILSTIESHYDVQFNYASSLIENVAVNAIDTSLSLKETIADLRQSSNLNFVFVSKKIISIRKKKRKLCGYITDKDSGELLPYVTIQNGSAGTLTNEAGYFEIEVNSDDDIIFIRHFGHKILQRQVRYFSKSSTCENIYLVTNHEQLVEIVVYDYLIRGVDKLDNGTFQIDFNKFSILPGLIDNDVLQAVQALPGVQSIDETVSNINIRGGSNDQNLITWDGIKMYQSGHFFGLISMYNPNITQKVELRKNGSNASETDGVSGTISMGTDKYINQKFKGSIAANLLDINGYIDTPLGKNASLQIAARKSISDLVETPTYSKYYKRISQDTEIENEASVRTNSDIGFNFYDTSFRLLVTPSDKDRLQFNFIHTANNVRFNETENSFGAQEIQQSNLKQSSIAGGIQYHRNWTDTFKTEVSVYETDYQLKGTNVNIQENQRFLQKNIVSETGAKLLTRTKLSSQLSLTNGYDFVETKVSNLDDVDDPRYVLLEAEVLRAHGAFSALNVSTKNKGTHLNLGLRYNYITKFKKTLWEPRISFNHDFWSTFNIEILGEYKHQNTSQIINFQNDFLGIEKRRWQLSNDSTIPIIRSKQVSLGLSHNQKGWLVNVVPFYKEVQGITTQSQGFKDAYEFSRERGNYDASGIDVLLRKQLKNSSSWISYSHLKSNYTFENLQNESFPSNFDITNTITAGTNYTIKSLLLATGFNWRTGKPFTRPIIGNEVENGTINYGEANSSKQSDYLRLDVSSKYQFNWREKTKLEVGVALWNILNRDNSMTSYYRLDASENIQKVDQSSLGLTPNATVKLIF
ncbi:TonB-dependent receptor [Cellulophaga baltica]|uniref:TonB-dependent receptor n=1 Tax=Cellulophaga baltica TaxID=76594 RepID=UPI0004218746|nr:carboxypeptidase-like regulatory domain-containing protein [Cellulophaga baltica]